MEAVHVLSLFFSPWTLYLSVLVNQIPYTLKQVARRALSRASITEDGRRVHPPSPLPRAHHTLRLLYGAPV